MQELVSGRKLGSASLIWTIFFLGEVSFWNLLIWLTLVSFLLIVLLLVDTVFVIFGSRVVDSVKMAAIVVFLQRPATQILPFPHWVPSTAGL